MITLREKKGEGRLLHILMGRARTGKSERVLQRIAALGDSSQQILLVPEHASHVAEMDLCRVCGDTASRHAEALTFKLLASRVLSICGGSADVTLDSGGKLLTLQRTLTELAPVLKVYKRPSQRAAFLESLLAVMEELQAYAVSPEQLSESVAQIEGESGDKLRDLSLIYGIYLSKLHAPGHDARDVLEKLEENLEASGYIDNKDIFLDGFSYFTGRELRILRILLRRAKSVTVTLLGDTQDRELFSESLRVRERLYALARDAGVACEEKILPQGEVRGALDHIERCFFGAADEFTQPTDTVALYEAGSAYSECEWVASQVLQLVRKQGYRYREITVTARDLDSYAGAIENVFARYGIPLYYAHRSDILKSPVLTLLLGALDAASGGFEYEDVFRCLKTGLAGLSAEECDLLENYVIKWDIRGAMWTRDVPWTAHPEGYGVPWRTEHEEMLARVNAAREKVRAPLSHLYEGVRGTGDVEGKVTALYNYLTEIALPEELQRQTETLWQRGETQRAEELAQLWNVLCGVLDQFVEMLGGTELDAEEFARLMRLVLTQYSVGTIPVSLDRVSLAEMTRNDRHAVRVLFLMGANDHVLPAVGGSGGILKDEDRAALEALDVRLAPYGMAQFRLELQNLYAALAQPTDRLYISYPRFDNAGAELRPSFVVGRVQTLCPSVKVETEDTDKVYRLTTESGALDYAGEHVGGEAWRYLERRGGCAEALAAMRDASHYTRGRLSREAVHTLYGRSITLSASRMDKARSCHFAYFMQYGLRAKERTAAGFDAPQVGTFVHDVMEHTLRAASERGGLKALERPALHALVRQAIGAYIEKNLPDLDGKNARFRYLFRRLCESVYRIMDSTVEELSDSDFEPLAFELGFGADGQLPAVTIREAGEELRVVGKVDRVDGWLKDGKLYLRVVDYKTGAKRFDLAELRYGLGLQMLLYLFTLRDEGGKLFGGYPIEPAGVLYLPAREKLLNLPRNASEEEIERAMHKELQRSGMVLNDPAVLRAMEHSALEAPCYLPVRVKKSKDGETEITGSIATSAQLGKLGLYVEEQLRRMVRELASGNIDADPWARSEQDSACTYCEFAPACHFENGRGGDRIEYIRATGAEQLWEHVDRMIGEGGKRDG